MEPEWEALVTDPLKLADEIEAGSDVRVMAYDKRHRLLLAAALRLAERASAADPVIESGDSFVCDWCGFPERRVSFRPHYRHRPDCAWSAYRAAREGT